MRRQLIVGMPESGKSTYIGALRHLLLAKEIETDLELTVLAEDEGHLNNLEQHWLSCEPMERTKTSNEAWVQLNVRDRATGDESLMIIPDLRGENFERPAAAGACPKPLHDALVAADGIALFTNANREEDTLLIDDFGDMFDDDDPLNDSQSEAGLLTDGQAIGLSNGTGEEGLESIKFKPEDMIEEVKIVEFLQLANRRPMRPKRRKLALIVSAWDVVSDIADMTPATWLAAKRPMLDQFIRFNDDLWDLRLYGVSAQGGELPKRKAEFEGMMSQSKRIRIIGGENVGLHDLTAPLRWLMTSG